MDYLPIRINTLRPDAPVKFDVFIMVGSRFVHYIRETDPFDSDRLIRLKEKGVKKLFIPSQAEDQYLLYLDSGFATLNNENKTISEKAAVANDGLVTSAENIEKNLDSERASKQLENNLQKVSEFLMSDRSAIKGILSTAGCSTDYFQHAATVSTLSLSMASKCGLTDSRELMDLGIAALVHDIGKTKLTIPKDKRVDDLNPQERREYEKHVPEAISMLSGKKMITPRILGLVASHEEIGNGQGFPEKKNFQKLSITYQILNICNDFDRFSYESKLLHSKAIDPYYEARGKYFNDELLATLATILT